VPSAGPTMPSAHLHGTLKARCADPAASVLFAAAAGLNDMHMSALARLHVTLFVLQYPTLSTCCFLCSQFISLSAYQHISLCAYHLAALSMLLLSSGSFSLEGFNHMHVYASSCIMPKVCQNGVFFSVSTHPQKPLRCISSATSHHTVQA
jgi:hypothetical protein